MYFGGGQKRMGGNMVFGGSTIFNPQRNDRMRKLGTSYLRKGSELLTEAAYERVRSAEDERAEGGRGGRGGAKRRGASGKGSLGRGGRGKNGRGNLESAYKMSYKNGRHIHFYFHHKFL